MDATYIKMCDTPKIQVAWEYQIGDRFWQAKNGELCFITHHEKVTYHGSIDELEARSGRSDIDHHCIWLPYQHQLQAMCSNNRRGDTLSTLLRDFYNWNYGSGYKWLSDGAFTSREQLELAFVMHELYGKTWDGPDWVNETV